MKNLEKFDILPKSEILSENALLNLKIPRQPKIMNAYRIETLIIINQNFDKSHLAFFKWFSFLVSGMNQINFI